MLKQLRANLVYSLWKNYRQTNLEVKLIEAKFIQHKIEPLVLDHFALIDLPGPFSGISHMQSIFSLLGYQTRGKDYLAEKQNDFLWMAEEDSAEHEAKTVLPQVVLADFRLDEMPASVKKIIEKYAFHASPPPIDVFYSCHSKNVSQCTKALVKYFSGREWPLPSLTEFYTVQAFNELLAWVLIFGRQVNHFGLSIHLLDTFKDLPDFHAFLENETSLPLNQEGGSIKGNRQRGIAQSATLGKNQTIALQDGTIKVPNSFIEFVWRYPTPVAPQVKTSFPLKWNDYFTGFIGQHADRVVESLYAHEA